MFLILMFQSAVWFRESAAPAFHNVNNLPAAAYPALDLPPSLNLSFVAHVQQLSPFLQ
jgi:hypothetical protein